jgi:hypothetical protein
MSKHAFIMQGDTVLAARLDVNYPKEALCRRISSSAFIKPVMFFGVVILSILVPYRLDWTDEGFFY